MGTINSVLYMPTDNWKQGKETPDTPPNFPKTPEDIKSHPDKYLGWLGRIAKEHPDPACRNFASIKYKIEYFARQTEINQMTDSANKEIDNANDGRAKLDGIQTSCQAGFTMIAVVSGAQLVAALGSLLNKAAIQMLQNSGPNLALAASGNSGINVVTSGGGTLALSEVQIQVLIEKGLVSATSLSMMRSIGPSFERKVSENAGNLLGGSPVKSKIVDKSSEYSSEAENLLRKFLNGNDSPGIGNNVIKKDGVTFIELRSRNGVRVYYRQTGNNQYEILGYSAKGDQPKVIEAIVKKLLGK